MSHLDIAGCKKRKRAGRIFRFKTFGERGHPVEFDGPFWQNVKALLEYGHLESNLSNGMPRWSFQLEVHRHPTVHVLLFVVEEPVEVSPYGHCKHCLHVGWGHHMICNKKYHFLLPSKDTAAACLGCDGHCHKADSENSKSNFLESQDHTMHGVFHSNGFGHLICVNGVEMGSELSGNQIMEFWDRLCTGLRARKVSLYDISRKRGMDWRLLHGVAYSEPWFGRWGYKYGRGSFGVTQPMYQKAIEAIQGIPLCLLIHRIGNSNHDIPLVFSRYQILSDHSLVTLGDLFQFMLELKSHLPKETCVDSYNPGILVETNCRWSPKRVEMATRVIVEALRTAEFRWISRQEVRDAARAYIGDTGLLDFVLKSLGNRIVGNYLVRRCLNPVTKVLEYCLEDISNAFPNQEGLIVNTSKLQPRHEITRLQLMKDMYYLYKYILREQKTMLSAGILKAIPMAAKIILDTKYFIKEYNGELPSNVDFSLEEKLKVYCTVTLSNNDETDEVIKQSMPPLECVIFKHNATINELKVEVEKSFQEIYWGLRDFTVKSIMNLNANESDLVFGLVRVGCKLVFKGSCSQGGNINEGVYESSQNNRFVDCLCGTQDDDGERMVSCDICEVWQHTRCLRIPNNEEVPHIFLCSRCEQDIILFPSLP